MTEHTMKVTLTDRVEALFRRYPGVSINARRIMEAGGSFAWRSRISDCRRRGLVIENRIRRVKTPTGSYAVTEYRCVAPSLITAFSDTGDTEARSC